MSINYERLFQEGRLSPTLPEHALVIKARLASMAVESPAKHEQFLSMYTDMGLEEEKPKKKKVAKEVKEKPVKKTKKKVVRKTKKKKSN